MINLVENCDTNDHVLAGEIMCIKVFRVYCALFV